MAGVIAEAVDTAIGAAHRDDPVLPRTGGPAGNARLTAWIGIVLFFAFAVEGATLLQLQQLIAVHLFVGAFIAPVALAKTATTTWRMARYYLGNRSYRAAGPPPLVLRVLGPAVVLTTWAVVGTGLALLPAGHNDQVLFLHKASFVLWFAATAVHVVGRSVPAVRIVAERRDRNPVPGLAFRSALMTVVVAAGIVVGFVVVAAGGSWRSGWGGWAQ